MTNSLIRLTINFDVKSTKLHELEFVCVLGRAKNNWINEVKIISRQNYQCIKV